MLLMWVNCICFFFSCGLTESYVKTYWSYFVIRRIDFLEKQPADSQQESESVYFPQPIYFVINASVVKPILKHQCIPTWNLQPC